MFMVMVALGTDVSLLTVFSTPDRVPLGSALLIALIAVALILVPTEGVTRQLLKNLRMSKNKIVSLRSIRYL